MPFPRAPWRTAPRAIRPSRVLPNLFEGAMRLHRTLVITLGLLVLAHGPWPRLGAQEKGPLASLAAEARPAAAQRVAARHSPVVDAVKRVRAAVVNIHSERTVHGA